MWKVLTFQNPQALEKYLVDNAVALAKVASIYFDAASGQHVLVLAP